MRSIDAALSALLPALTRLATEHGLEAAPGKKVLEIGCGLGTDSINFARHGAEVTVIDRPLTTGALTIAPSSTATFTIAPSSTGTLAIAPAAPTTGDPMSLVQCDADGYSIGGQVWIQLQAVLTTVVWSGVVSFVAYFIVDKTIGLRVSEEDEREGLDITSHGESAYGR